MGWLLPVGRELRGENFRRAVRGLSLALCLCAAGAGATTPTRYSPAGLDAVLSQIELLKDSQPAQALDESLRLYRNLDRTQHPEARLRLLKLLAEIQIRRDDYGQALLYAEDLLARARDGRLPAYQAEALLLQGALARLRSDYDAAQALLAEARSVGLQVAEPVLIAAIDYQLAILDYRRGATDQALDTLQPVLETYRAHGERRREGRALNLLSILYGTQGRHEEAWRAMLDALAIARTVGDRGIEVALLNNMAVALNKMGRKAEAIEAYRESLAAAREQGDLRSEALALANLGADYLQLGRLEQARLHAAAGLEIARQLENASTQSRATNTLARIAQQGGDVDAALALAEQALALADSVGDRTVGFGPRKLLIEIYRQRGDVERARALAARLRAEADAAGDRGELVDAIELEAELLAAAGQPEQALARFREYMALDKSLFTENSDRMIAGMRARFGAQQKDLEIERLRQDRAQRELALQGRQIAAERQRFRMQLGLALALAALVLVFMGYRRWNDRRLTERLEAEVSRQTRSLNRKNAELQQAYTLMEKRSLTDELTGLRNRRYFYRQLCGKVPPEAQSQSRIYLLLDLDHFKAVNDIHGHAAGDQVLVQTAELLGQVLRKSDDIVRWGGEEFLVVMRDCSPSDAAGYAERLRDAVASHRFRIGGGYLDCTISIGFVALGAPLARSLNWTRALELADQCLYTVKRSRRNAWLGFALDGAVSGGVLRSLGDSAPGVLQGRPGVTVLSSLPADTLQWEDAAAAPPLAPALRAG